jgi:hypothetical protein
LIATMTASVPELTKRILSKPAARPQRCRARSISTSVAMVQAVPRDSCAATAATIAGWAWPWISDAMLLAKSRSSAPSTSVIRHPFASRR